jgi:hypothetical protein
MTIKYKAGVNLAGVRNEIMDILPLVESCFRDLNCMSITLTCTTGNHKLNDPHTNGFAIDIRMHDYSIELQNRLFNHVNKTLSGLYYTVLEFPGKQKAHLHIQVYKGTWNSILLHEDMKRRI